MCQLNEAYLSGLAYLLQQTSPPPLLLTLLVLLLNVL